MLGFVPQSFHGRSRGYGKQVEDNDVKIVREQLDKAGAQIRRAWLRFVGRFDSGTTDQQFREAYAWGDMTALDALIEEPFDWFLEQFPAIFTAAAERATQEFVTTFEINFVKVDVDPSVNISFNPGDAAAAAAMREAQLDLIREIMEEQRKVIRAAMERALNAGLGSAEASRLFRNSIGLTEYQNSIVDKFERKLRLRDPSALNNALRDRRFDASLRRAVSRGQDLAEEKIQRMVSRYRERFVAMRAETIARTEGLRTVNSARHVAMDQLSEKVGLDKNRIIRIWRSTDDMRTRYTHRLMNGQRRGAKEAFRSPRGAKLRYPGDRRAPPEESINCRCVLVIKIKGPEDAAVLPGQAPGRVSAPRALPGGPPIVQHPAPTPAAGAFEMGGDTWVRGSRTIPTGSGWSTSPLPEVPLSSNPLTVLKPTRGDAWDTKGIAKDVDANIDDLMSWQTGIDVEKLRPIVGEVPPIKLAQVNGKLVIMDGNHRAVSAWLAGDKTIAAKFVNFDTIKNKKWYKPKYKPSGTLPDSDGISPPKLPSGFTHEQQIFRASWSDTVESFELMLADDLASGIKWFNEGPAKTAFEGLVSEYRSVIAAVDAGNRQQAIAAISRGLRFADELEALRPEAKARLFTQWIRSASRKHKVTLDPPALNPYTDVADNIYAANAQFDFYQSDVNKRYIREKAARTKSTAEQIRSRLQKKAEKFSNEAHLYVRIPDDPKVLNSILNEGRLKTQFETGTSRGALDNDYRAKAERALFGMPRDAVPSSRPIYGYATNDLNGMPTSPGSVQGYGYVALKLKPSKRPYTTVTGGDSLGRSYQPSPLNSPNYDSFDAEMLDKAKSIQGAAHPYAEVQIGRGVSLADDVEEVIFYVYRGDTEMYRNYEMISKRFEDMGVPTRVVEI